MPRQLGPAQELKYLSWKLGYPIRLQYVQTSVGMRDDGQFVIARNEIVGMGSGILWSLGMLFSKVIVMVLFLLKDMAATAVP